MPMPDRIDAGALATSLRERFPTRQLLMMFLDKVCPAEAPLFSESLACDEALHLSAAKTLIALGIPLPVEEHASIAVKDSFDSQVDRYTTFESFFSTCVEELEKSHSLRVSLVGPTFLEPLWLHRRTRATRNAPDFTVSLRKRVFDGTLRCEMILRNNRERYVLNLREFVSDRVEWQRIIDEMLKDSFKILGNRGEKGPRVRCFDPGFAFPLHIFDNSVLIGTRRTAAERVRGGWRLQKPDMVKLERERWSMIFDESPQSQADAVEIIRSFLDDIRSDF